MLIYQRYISFCVLAYLTISIFVISGLVWIPQVLRFLYLIDKGIGIFDFLHLVFLIVPSLLFILFPVATMVAIIYTYHNLHSEGQLIILRNSGLTNFQLVKPALLAVCCVTIFTYYLSISVLPATNTTLKTSLAHIKDSYIIKIINEKTFTQISKSLTVYIDGKLPNGTMKSVVIFDDRDSDAAILFAKTGILKMQNNKLVLFLQNGNRQVYDTNGNLNKLHFNSLIFDIKENKEDSNQIQNRDISEYSVDELLHPDKSLPSINQNKMKSEGHQRLIWPIYNLLLPLIGLAIFLKIQYTSNYPLLITVLASSIIAVIHFSLYTIACKNSEIIYFCYINIVVVGTIAAFLYNKHTL